MGNVKKKNRLDLEIVKRKLVSSKKEASAMIMAGEIVVDGQVVYRADLTVNEANIIEIKKKYPYVSRGGFKIQKAVADFSIHVEGLKVLDIGISTGGFSDYMLKNGAERVTGVDVNVDQVDYNLKKNKRLKLLKKNARFLKKEDINFEPDLITMDVSFISVTKILPALSVFKNSKILALIKPQFEADRHQVDRGGVISGNEKIMDILETLTKRVEELNYSVIACTQAGVKGRRGNQEYFFLLEYGKR